MAESCRDVGFVISLKFLLTMVINDGFIYFFKSNFKRAIFLLQFSFTQSKLDEEFTSFWVFFLDFHLDLLNFVLF